MTTAKLRSVGGSVTVALPRPMLRQLGLEAGSEVEVTIGGQCLTLSPKRKRYSLAELLHGMKPGDMPTAPDWQGMPATGREIW